MFKLYDFLSPDVCQDLVEQLKNCDDWQDGKHSAGNNIRHLKSNSELKPCEVYDNIAKVWVNSIFSPHIFEPLYSDTMYNFVLPPMVNRYKTGESYGWHFDNTLMTTPHTSEPKVMHYSYTLFLNDDYSGGELQIENECVKGTQGQLLVYENTYRHRVKEVIQGTRYACVGWMQSLIDNETVKQIIMHNDRVMIEEIDKNELLTSLNIKQYL